MPIVYDQAHSTAVGPSNMNCVPGIREQCARELPDDAAQYAHELATAHAHIDECRDIQLFVDPGDGHSKEVNRVKTGAYWALTLDYKPTQQVQAFKINGVHGGGPGIQGDGLDTYDLMRELCKVSKDGGSFIYW